MKKVLVLILIMLLCTTLFAKRHILKVNKKEITINNSLDIKDLDIGVYNIVLRISKAKDSNICTDYHAILSVTEDPNDIQWEWIKSIKYEIKSNKKKNIKTKNIKII